MLFILLLSLVSGEDLEQLPQASLIDPLPRKFTPFSSKPCDGKSPGHAHTLLETDSFLPITLSIKYPADSANCTFRLIDVKDPSKTQPLLPLYSQDKVFACGRDHADQETKIVRMPSTQVCETCILEIIWRTQQGDFYECADLLLEIKSMPSCKGVCQNDGLCTDEGFCICKKGYTGQYCDLKAGKAEKEEESHLLWKFILFLFLFMLASFIGACVYFYIHPAKMPASLKKLLKKDDAVVGDDMAMQFTDKKQPGAQHAYGGNYEAEVKLRDLNPEPYGVHVNSHSRESSSSER